MLHEEEKIKIIAREILIIESLIIELSTDTEKTHFSSSF